MYTIHFVNGPERYEARVELSKPGVLSVSVRRHGEERALLDLCGNRRTSWRRLVECDEFVPLGVVRRSLKIFDEQIAKARAR